MIPAYGDCLPTMTSYHMHGGNAEQMDGELEEEQGATEGERMDSDLEEEQGATEGEWMDCELEEIQGAIDGARMDGELEEKCIARTFIRVFCV